MSMSALRAKYEALVRCSRRALALGYQEILYTEDGFALMKYNRVIRNFKELDELDAFLCISLERHVNLGKELPSVMNFMKQNELFRSKYL